MCPLSTKASRMSVCEMRPWSRLALVAGLSLLAAACATKPPQTTAPAPAAESAPAEPDLLAQLRERMAKPVVRAEKKEEAAPVAPVASSQSQHTPTVVADPVKVQQAQAVAPEFALAMQLMNDGKLDDAMAKLQTIEQKAPQFAGPLLNQGLILVKQKRYADAITTLQRAIALNDKNPYGHNLLGIALRETGRFQDARAAYEKAIALDANYAKAHFNLAVLADLYLQDLPLALAHYEKYQQLQMKADQGVANWIVDLQKRTGVWQPPKPVAAPVESTPAPASDTEQMATPSSMASPNSLPATAAGVSSAASDTVPPTTVAPATPQG